MRFGRCAGFVLDNPTDLSARLNRVLAQGLKVDPEAVAEDEPEEPEAEPEAPATEEGSDAPASEDADTAHATPSASDDAEELAKNLAGDRDKDEL